MEGTGGLVDGGALEVEHEHALVEEPPLVEVCFEAQCLIVQQCLQDLQELGLVDDGEREEEALVVDLQHLVLLLHEVGLYLQQ